jgi:hypothetical protein
MNEQAIIDSYNLFVQNGYKKSIEEYKQLLSSNPNAVSDSYNLFQQNGYKKSIEDYKILMGVSPIKASGQESEMPVELQKKNVITESPSALGSSVSSVSAEADPEALRFAELVSKQGQIVGKRRDEPGYIDPRKKLGMYPTQEETNKAMTQFVADIDASKGIAPEYEEKDFFEGGFKESLRFVDQYVPVFNVFGIGEFIDDSARVLASGYANGQLASAANDIMFTGTIPKEEEIEKLIDQQGWYLERYRLKPYHSW